MIKYKLICKNCNLSFDSWFASSNEFEKLKKKNLLNCHNCDSKKIDKTLMSPKIMNYREKSNKNNFKFDQINKKIKEYQKFIKDNFEYVGENFAYEARSIHYDKKNVRSIYGKATPEQTEELMDEGIEVSTIPWVNKTNS